MPDLTVHSIDCANLRELAAEVLGSGNVLRFRVCGASMFPFVRDNDIVEVHPLGASPLRRGTIVLCYSNAHRVLVHRIIKVRHSSRGAEVLTRGDAFACADGWIPQEQVLGRVAAVERKGRIIALGSGWRRWLGAIWIRSLPLSRWLFRALSSLKRQACRVLSPASAPGSPTDRNPG